MSMFLHDEDEAGLECATIAELATEFLGRIDSRSELAAAYHRGEFDLKGLAREIGVDEFKRVAASL